jgi:glycosyltransferase 2 family protein
MGKKLPKVLLAVGLTAVFFYFFARSVEWRKVPGYIADVDLPLFLLLIPGAAVHFFTRALRWGFLLAPVKTGLRYRNLVAANIVGFTVNAIFPGRVGELAKPLYLARKEGLRTGFLVGTVVVERMFDFFTMCFFLGLFFLARPLFSRSHPIEPAAYDRLTYWGILGVVLATALLALMLLLHFFRGGALRVIGRLLAPLPERFRERVLGLLGEFIDGLKSFRTPGVLAGYTLLSFAVWVGIILFYWLLFTAYRVPVPFFLVVPYVFLGAVGASIPTPGMVGGFHYFSKIAMTSLLLIGPDQAAGMTLVAHAVQIGVTCALGYAILSAEGLTLFQLRKMGESDKR